MHQVRRQVVEERLAFDLKLAHVHWSNYQPIYLAQRTKRKRGVRTTR